MASYALLGSSISNEKLAWLSEPYKKIFVWLDSDKYPEAIAISERIKALGKNSSVIFTDKDPKYIDDFKIRELINAN